MTEEEGDGFVDEILCADDTVSASISKTDRALLILEEWLTSDEFQDCQDAFAERHCDLFDLTQDLPPQCMRIYKEYVALVEGKLLQKVRASLPDFDFEELIPVVRQHKSDEGFQFANVFEILNAAIDFNEFRALMASYKDGRGLSLDVQTIKLEP